LHAPNSGWIPSKNVNYSQSRLRSFAMFNQVKVRGAEACPDGSTLAHRVEGKIFMVIPYWSEFVSPVILQHIADG